MNKLIACIVLCTAVGFAACNKEDDSEHIAVTDITLNTTVFALKLGAIHTLTATVAPEDATERSVMWSSDDETVAKVDPVSGVVSACGLGKTTIRVTPATNRTPEASCTITVLSREPYVVGDLYPDGTKPQGMVFWLDPADPLKGKIVSLDQTSKRWGSKEVVTSALDSNDGRKNMSAIETLENWKNDYPAFAWCAAKGAGWYLPALNELLTLYEAKEVLDEIILQNGDTPFTASDYWTSTERRQSPQTTAVTVVLRHVTNNESWASKDGQCAVRAIKTF